MTSHQGALIWYELMTADAERARTFYEAVIGWEIPASADNPNGYRQITAPDGDAVGGMLPLSRDMLDHGARPGWFAYVCVDDVDAELAALKSAGGHVFMDQDNPVVGRMALVADPQGVPIYLMNPIPPADQPDKVSTAFSPQAKGHASWNELMTPDPAGAESYYTGRFGWTRGGTLPMGPMGDYVFLNRGDGMLGALMKAPEGQQGTWRIYWRTGDIDAAAERITAAGGAIRNPPHQVPGGDWIVQANDPEGVFFGLVGSRA